MKRQIENERKKKKLVTYTLVLLIGLYIIFNIALDDMGIVKFLELKEKEQNLIIEIASLQNENLQIEKEIRLLGDNLFYIEKHARENLNLAGPNEYIFLYEQ
ncbi:MAG: septum formation initiator family protein [Nitrospirota bacterium]|nr:MAG: septum formation initiator family protein [Nitrospirota bacterium]